MTYILGIDVGIASVGFAGVNHSEKNIIFCGTHIFEAAENPKDGASLAAPRREKRGIRRVLSRRSQRKNQIRNLLKKHGFQNLTEIDQSRTSGVALSPWDLRGIAFERLLTDGEFARILFHIAKRRGFQSNKKGGADANDTEGKKVLTGAGELEEKWIQSGDKSIAAFLSKQPKQRNGDGDYNNSVKRDRLREEIKMIFEAQRRFGNTKATDILLYEFAGDGKKENRNTKEGDGIAFYQRPLQSSEHLVGFCTFEDKEKRAPKFSYSAELFVIWSRINNTKILTQGGDERTLTKDEKQRLLDLAHKNKSGVTYKQARKELSLADTERFNISYRKIKDDDNSWEKIRDNTEAGKFLNLAGYHALKEALHTGSETDWQHWLHQRRDALDDIARILSFYEDRKEVDDLLSKHNLNDDQKSSLCKITNFSKTVDLSLKAIKKILPHMEQEQRYDEACSVVYGHHGVTGTKSHALVPPFEDIRNPVVNRALAQTRKVINACIRKYGKPESIIIELARDVGKPFEDRKKIEKENKKYAAFRDEAKKHAAEITGISEDNIRNEEILKYRLWKEQEGFCPYSGEYMTPELLRDDNATQIDHIIPYSRSWNDSYMNKILCKADENQRKGNKTAYEYMIGSPNFPAFEALAARLPHKKAELMLLQQFDSREQGWKERALNDTRYMAKALKNHLEDSLDLGKGNRVQARNGALTANLRGAWGFPDKNRRNDRHHAIDAIVLACSTQGMVQALSNWNKYEARKKNPAARPTPPAPWETFRNDAMNAVHGSKAEDGNRQGGIFVSRMPVRKITGAAHQETIRSIRKSDGKIIQRIKLKSLTLSTLEKMVDKDRNRKLYNLLKERLEAHGDKPEKAFAEPVFMPVNNPSTPAPRINSIRYETNEKSGIVINEGLASNGDQIRIDVFLKSGKFFAVPIYVHHFTKNELPNKAVVAYADEENWEVMDDNDFLFSLYKNDLVRIKSKTEDYFAYYTGTIDRSTGAISIRAHDSDPSFSKKTTDGTNRTGIKTLLAFEKYSVDYFGNKSRILREKRLGVAQHHDSKSGATVSLKGAAQAAE